MEAIQDSQPRKAIARLATPREQKIEIESPPMRTAPEPEPRAADVVPVIRTVASGPFSNASFRFTTGLHAGEVAHILGEDGQILLSYRSFASVSGVVAALVSGIVFVVGLAAALFLLAEHSPLRAGVVIALTILFAFIITLLVPRVNVTIYDDGQPALTISERSTLMASAFIVSTPNGARLAELRKGAFSRLGRNRWQISSEGRYIGEAFETSLVRAIVRKFLGKFNRSFETDLAIEAGSLNAGRIIRRPTHEGETDVLKIENDVLDRRVAVALATLVLGSEP
jgi:hypothetical protein